MQRVKRTEIDRIMSENFGFLAKDWRVFFSFVLLFLSWLSVCLMVVGKVSFQSGFSGHLIMVNQLTQIALSLGISRLEMAGVMVIAFLVSLYAVELLVLVKENKRGSRPLIEAVKRYPSFLASSIIFLFLVFVLFFAFVIPSVFIFVKMLFYPQESLLKRRNPIASLHASYDFTSGKFWQVFGLVAGIALVAVALTIIVGFVARISFIAFAVLDAFLWAFITVFLIGATTDYFLSEQRSVR